MRLATLRDGTKDGRLVVVSPDGTACADAPCGTLQEALENWDAVCADLAAIATFPDALDSALLAAPLPRAWQWLDGSAFPSHGDLMDKMLGMTKPPLTAPLMYQGTSDKFYGPNDDVKFPSADLSIDFEGEFGVIVDFVPMGSTPAQCLEHIRLVVQINDWSLRALAGPEMKTGFGWVQAKPPCAMAPFAVTPDELGAHWRNGRVCLDLLVDWNGARFGAAELPPMKAIDMRGEKLPADRWISAKLAAEVQARVAKGEQSLLFLNRRGYAPITLCRACGHQVGCDDCDARMVEHRFLKRLVCHQCGATKPVPVACPSCGVEGRMAAVGPGVERLAEEVTARFPDARLAVLSSDLFGSARALKEAVVNIAEGGADIIIGTQIVAKGHNFPLLTLVGVIDADLGLQGSDLRAAERTFQLMRQVAGRAGRADKPGAAWLQSHQPDHPVIRAILGGDEEAFWRAEAAERRAAGVPPYGRMAGIILSSPDVAQVFDFGAELARRDGPLRRVGAQVFGPAPAPIARVRGRHRVRLLVKAEKTVPLQVALAEWVGQMKLPTNLRLAVDIDPQSFY